MGTDSDDELLNVRASGAALVRVLYRDLVTILLLSVAWTLAALPVITLGSATLALNETVTKVITDQSKDRILSERARLQEFGSLFRRYFRTGIPLSIFMAALFVSVWLHAQIYAMSGQWLFSASTLVGIYLLVIGVTWAFRAASLIVRAPPESRPGVLQAFLDGAELALEYPHYSGLQLLTVAGLFILMSVKPIAVPLLLPGAIAAVEVVTFEELVDRGAADIRQYYAEVP